ncbi:uncharacterized protein C1orf87 homolog [Microcaecilia unicolor]|uniref:Uncharacterized protein C1orf87 homolog n=1 Tax=Microcaecilia unicolor TaxID=1415580 RepID=A0A6P7YB66_9AMPH|nr:uncharacterized protein C1orf87 homolog [Microcaecilia unicolor]XP_030062277.1 uncharacterized protein C1orf87 homolog [Microcaecilia unicolor]XP_030062278.1 uncharacterized protein C1orf87 homolog [Microcaecilia unicolor]
MNVPFGTDATPEIIVKIVGSKYIKSFVEKPKITTKQLVKNNTQPELVSHAKRHREGSSVDPPNPHDKIKNDQGYEQQDRGKHRGQQFAQVFKGPNVQCITAPSGDQTLSYIHTLKNPPIGFQRSSQQDAYWTLPNPANEDEILLSAVRNELRLQSFSVKAIDDLQAEITVLDPTLFGFLPESQINHLFLKHRLPLQLPTVKLLLERFTETKDPELVNYEKLLWFLRLSLSNKTQISKTLASDLPVDSQALMDDQKSFSTTEEEISWILKEVLSEQEGLLNIEKIKESFQTKDRSSSGLLPRGEVETVCLKHGLLVPHSLFEAVLNSNNLNENGKIRWQKFTELLNRAQADAKSLLLIPARKAKRKSYSAGDLYNDPGVFRSQHAHLKETSESVPENPAAVTKTTGRRPRPATQAAFQATDHIDSEEQDTWIDRFQKVEKAFQLCDTRNTGMVEKQRAKRLIQNYNMIFNLRLSPLKIDQAIHNFHSGENVIWQPVLQYLKEL